MVLVGEKGLECDVIVDGDNIGACKNFSEWCVFWMHQVQVKHFVLGSW